MNRKLGPPLRDLAVDDRHRSSHDVKHHAWITSGEPLDDGEDGSTCRVLAARDPQFPRRRIGEEFYVFHALPELIKHRKATLDERAAIWRRLDALRAAIQQAN